MTLVTQSAYARHRKVERQQVHKWKKAGKLVMAKNAAGRDRVDLEASDAALGVFRNPLKEPDDQPGLSLVGSDAGGEDGADPSPPPAPTVDPHIAAAKNARAMREITDAQSAKIKLERLAGTLVPTVEIEGIGAVAAATLHQVMARAIPDLSRELVHVTTEREAQTILGQAFFDIQSAFADQLLAFDGVVSGGLEATG